MWNSLCVFIKNDMRKNIMSITGLLMMGASMFMMGCNHTKGGSMHHLSKAEKAHLDSIDSASFKIAVMPTLDCLPLWVAKSERLFDTLGVDVHLHSYTAQMDCDTALMRGRVEGSVTDLVRAANMHRRGTALAFPISTDTYWQLITNRKARISDLKQLSDKMIANTRYSATDYLTNIAIDSVHPKYDVYRVQINDVNIRLKMLLNNEMDAMLLTEPQATRARLEGHPVLMDSRDKGVHLGVFAFRDKSLQKPHRKQQLALFLKGYDRAVDSINKNGVQHYADLIKKYSGADDATIKALPRMKFSHAKPPKAMDKTKADKAF